MRKLAWFTGGFGAICLFSCYRPPNLLYGILFLVLSTLFGVLYRRLLPKNHENFDISLLPPLRLFFLQLGRRAAVFFLGSTLALLWVSGYTALFLSPATELADTEQSISGTVTTYPESTSIGGYSLLIRLDGDFRAPDVLFYGSEEWGELSPGDRITCTARLKSSEFLYGDETTYYTARGIYLLGYCNDPPTVEKASSIPIRYWPVFCAQALKSGISAAFDPVAVPLAAAVTLGDKSGLSEQTYSALNRSGIMHAAVVSGMHITFLSSLLLVLCGWRRNVALLLVPILFFYALMAGGTPSALRAVIMQTALLAGPLLDRENDNPTSLSLALMLLLIQNPFAAASVSLQLSFSSAAGIMLVASRLSEAMLTPVRLRLRDRGKFWRFVLTVYRVVTTNIAVSLGAMLFSVPLIALYFDQILLVAPLTNILTLWAATALMVCALVVGTIAIFLPGLAVIPGNIAGLLAHYITGIASFIGRFPFSTLDASNLYILIWLLAVYLLLLTIVFARKRAHQTAVVIVFVGTLLINAIGLTRLTVKRTDLTLTALDVGQGASTLILSGTSAVLVDCGGNAASSAGDLAADRLASMGRTTLDALVLTHLDDDHFNGVTQLFWRLDVKQVFVSKTTTEPEHLVTLLSLADAEGAAVIFVDEICTLSAGHTQLTLYPPLGSGTSNEEGLFVLCSYGDFQALITGDADSFVERLLIKYYPIPDLDLLLVGHHGSKHSTCAEFLDVLRPELAIISVGHNSYGHPAEETLARLTAAGAQTYRTDLSGPITVRLQNGLISIH